MTTEPPNENRAPAQTRRTSGSASEFLVPLEAIPAAAYTCDADGLITDFNRRAAEAWGREPALNDPIERFCGSFKLFAADGSPVSHDRCWMARTLQEKQGFNGEEVIERPDGSRTTVLAHANPVYDESGGLVGAVNILFDIAGRKRAEDAPGDSKVRSDPGTTEHPLRVLLVEDDDACADFVVEAFEDTPEPVCVTRRVRLKDALQYLATTPVDVVLLDLTLPDAFDLVGVNAIRLATPDVALVVLTGSVDPTQGSRVTAAGADDYLQKDQIDASLLVRSIRYARDRHRYLEDARRLVTLAGLNEALEQRVRERTAKIEASEAALLVAARHKDEFLGALAHELRTPLTPLRTGLDILLHAQPASPVVAGTLAAMNRQLDHMVHLIDDLLDVARISQGLIKLQEERADIATLVESAIESCRPFFDKRRQSISFDAHRSMFGVVDPTRVAQILANLLHNAAKFTPEGGEVRVELALEDGHAIIRIIDSGVGLAPEQIRRIFDMFVQVDRSQPHAGLGIGLALARRLAELHGGELTASSAGVGRGSIFMLALPGVSQPDQSPAPASSERRVDGTASLCIVVVDDDEDSADTLAMWLTIQGHTVTVARTGPAGLELVQATRPNIVLCDIGLPGMDGVEVCRCVRGLSSDYRPTMIALSGWGREQDRLRTSEAGFDHHMVKPVKMDELRAVLKGALLARPAPECSSEPSSTLSPTVADVLAS